MTAMKGGLAPKEQTSRVTRKIIVVSYYRLPTKKANHRADPLFFLCVTAKTGVTVLRMTRIEGYAGFV